MADASAPIVQQTGIEPIALSIVVPTYNESKNVELLLQRISAIGLSRSWEILFVDDASPDGTSDVVRKLAQSDRRVRLISRHNRRGLASAVVEGGLAAAGDVVVVMDGDLQHDEEVIQKLFNAVATGRADIAVASRFLTPDGADGLASQTRLKVSTFGIRLANRAFGLNLTDPLTGFFAVRRDVLAKAVPNLSELGFKILLDLIIATRPRPKIVEVPFQFRNREFGESKLDTRVMYEFFLFLIEKTIGRVAPIPARFISFALINAFGILVHILAFMVATVALGSTFLVGQLAATLIAMFSNFYLNNLITYFDKRLEGRKFFVGFIAFMLVSSVGIFGNVGVASMLHNELGQSELYLPAIAGALVTVVWNYIATSVFVWGRTKVAAPA